MSNNTDSTKDRLSTPDWAQIPKKKETQTYNHVKRSSSSGGTLLILILVGFGIYWLIPVFVPPTVTIEEIVTTDADEEFKRRWRINTNRRARKDFVVLVSQAREDSGGSIQVFWVLIPKSSRHSEAFAFDYNIKVEIHPLPMASIVGKGKVVDLDKLQKGLPVETLGGHRITEDFDFPLYKVGEPSSISERFAP